MEKLDIKDYDNILFCGIGGSAVPGEIVKSIGLKKPVLISRETFPEFASSKTLCFVVSYSGNTKETLKLYNEAKKRKCRIIIITSGGSLENKNEEVFIVPKGHVPREALVYMLDPILRILGILNKNSESLEKILEKILTSKDENYSKKIAEILKNKIPIIYSSSERLNIISETWETLFNENSKILAHSNYFPQLAHNEIEAIINENCKVVFILDKETPTIKKAKKIIKNHIGIKLKGKNLVEKMLYGIYFGNLVSKHIAKFKGINYRETKRINLLK